MASPEMRASRRAESETVMDMHKTAADRELVPSALVRRSQGQVWLTRDEEDTLKLTVPDRWSLSVLEAFVFAAGLDEAFERFRARRPAVAVERLRDIDGMLSAAVDVRCRVGAGTISATLPEKRRIDVTEVARESGGALDAIAGMACTGDAPTTAVTRAAFEESAACLLEAGVLSPSPGSVRFGDFRRRWPFSQRFGFDRGAPVDRYYLRPFVRSIRASVRGRCLEIGGFVNNNDGYRFRVDEFRTLELPKAGIAADFLGDAADRTVFEDGRWDSILAFHVLEHCADPFAVVRNMRAWLAPGGHVYVVVPCAQRLHNFPGDYWRFMPDGLRVLFKDFSSVAVSTYGNPLSLVSSYLGLSHTELTAEEMEFRHPDFPVIACVVARN